MFKYRSVGFPRLKSRLGQLGAGMTRTQASAVGKTVVAMMLDLILAGQSPIKGRGAFPKYKNPKKYPGDLKPHSPVNLFLSGKFLNSLKSQVYQRGKGYAVEIGYFTKLSAKKEQGHREGANGQPRRPTIPKLDKRERFTDEIQNAARAIILDAIKKR